VRLVDSMLATRRPLLVYGGVLPVQALVAACVQALGPLEPLDLRRAGGMKAADVEAAGRGGKPVVALLPSVLPATLLAGLGRLVAGGGPVVALSPADRPEATLWGLFPLRLAADAALEPSAGGGS
jgi:hypothetical protein